MSDSWIQFLPDDATVQPTHAAADNAVQLLKSLAPDAEEIEAEFSEKPNFIAA
jgi:hypothetical protein